MTTTPTDLDLCTNAQAELAAILDEQAEPSQLPPSWRRYSSSKLEALLSEFSEPYLTDDDYDDVIEELDGRHHEADELTGHHDDQLDYQHNERPIP